MNEISEKAVESGCIAAASANGQCWPDDFTDAKVVVIRSMVRAALTAALPHLMGEADEYEFEVWQEGNYMAGGYADDLEYVQREANHYAMMYGQDGEVKVKIIARRMVAPTTQERGNG